MIKLKNILQKPYRLQCIDISRFNASLSSNLIDNLAEGIHETKCKYGHDNKKCKTCGINNFGNYREYKSSKDDLMR